MVILSTLERFHFLSSSWGIVSGLQLLIHKCSIEGLPGTDMSFFSDPNITELKIYAAIISLYILAFGGKAETIYKKGLQKQQMHHALMHKYLSPMILRSA